MNPQPNQNLTAARRHVALVAALALSVPATGGEPRPLILEPGLVAVSATNDAVLHKDYEAVLSVLSVGEEGSRSKTDWAIPDKDAPEGVQRQTAQALERREDSDKARRLIIWHLPGDPETMPGTTGPTPSVAVFNEIVTTGEAAVVVGAMVEHDGAGLGGLLGGLLVGRKYFRGTVKRIGIEPIRVLVDGRPTMLNTIHVAGTVSVGDDQADVAFWWVNDPATRFALRVSFQGSLSQVIRIDRPVANADTGSAVEQSLAGKNCRAEIPGIYFLTDSAQLLPASTPAIERIAATLRAHADWTVTIEGHTDRTGSDEHNLDLSRRRAAALKSELVSKYDIAAARLQTAGYGRTRPVDSNETLEGRGHNRRVEISRRC